MFGLKNILLNSNIFPCFFVLLMSLCERRLRGDILQTFKIIHYNRCWSISLVSKVSGYHQKTRNAVTCVEWKSGDWPAEFVETEVQMRDGTSLVVGLWTHGTLCQPVYKCAKDVDGFKEAHDNFIGGDSHQWCGSKSFIVFDIAFKGTKPIYSNKLFYIIISGLGTLYTLYFC